MDLLLSFGLETAAALVGLLAATLGALALERRKERAALRRRAALVLRSLKQELDRDLVALVDARPAFHKTPWGRTFYLSTTAWDTAVASGDLPRVVGDELTDALTAHYGTLVRVRYYLDLMTRLWLAPAEIDGRDRIREGFSRAIRSAMDEAVERQPRLLQLIASGLREVEA